MSGEHNRYQKPDYIDRRQWKYDPMTGEPLIDGWPLYSGLPEPEPVAWISAEETWLVPKLVISDTPKDGYKPVYTAPPQREWQGLTDEEMEEAMKYWSDPCRSAYGGAEAADDEYVDMIGTWRYIEAKLKEKNAPNL